MDIWTINRWFVPSQYLSELIIITLIGRQWISCQTLFGPLPRSGSEGAPPHSEGATPQVGRNARQWICIIIFICIFQGSLDPPNHSSSCYNYDEQYPPLRSIEKSETRLVADNCDNFDSPAQEEVIRNQIQQCYVLSHCWLITKIIQILDGCMCFWAGSQKIERVNKLIFRNLIHGQQSLLHQHQRKAKK